MCCFVVQQWRRSGGCFWTDFEGPARFPHTILGQCVWHCQGLCLEVLFSSAVVTLHVQHQNLSVICRAKCSQLTRHVSVGFDHRDAAGGGGREIHSCAGARSPLGQCEFSVLKSALWPESPVCVKKSWMNMQQVEMLKLCLYFPGWWCVRE